MQDWGGGEVGGMRRRQPAGREGLGDRGPALSDADWRRRVPPPRRALSLRAERGFPAGRPEIIRGKSKGGKSLAMKRVAFPKADLHWNH